MSSGPAAHGLPANATKVLNAVTDIAVTPGALGERADALLTQVEKIVPFDAAWIALLPPGERVHVPLIRRGYDARVCSYLDSDAVLADVELTGMYRSRLAVRGQDLRIPLSQVPGWAAYMEPAGFRQGLGVGLFGTDGRYLGVVAMHTSSATPISRAARDLIGLVAAQIGAAVDPLRSIAAIAGIVHTATAGVVLTSAGAALPLPGMPGHLLLAPHSGVLAVAWAGLGGGNPHSTFLALDPDGTPAKTHVRITVLAAPHDMRRFAAAVVLVSPPGDLYGLSPRELQVLGLLVTGASNQQIAVALGISVRTVAAHVDNARTKLDAPSRTAAAARALRQGLYVPVGLLDRGRPDAPGRGTRLRDRAGGEAAI